MNYRIRVILYGMMIALLALASAFSIIPARADDGAPPPPTGGASPAKDTPTDLSQASSTGTDVVVVNDAGHKVPLASQEAARIVADGDPMWCPVGAVPGAATCSTPGNSFQSVIDWMGAQTKGRAGVIWVESSYDRSVGDNLIHSFTLDGTVPNLTLFAPYSLTINGGWTGTRAVLNPNTPSVFDGASLSIYNWKNAVTLNNITIENGPGDGLFITTTGNIVLNNINSRDNHSWGAYLNSTAGTVTVNYSTFDGNVGDGLHVVSNRAILVKNIAANDNTWDGVYLDNSSAPSAQPVTITGVNNFNFNSNIGLVVWSKGAITLGNVTAIYNISGDGAYLDNCNYNTISDYCDFPGSYAITLKGRNNFNDNGLDGLEIWASGTITANNLSADNNGTAMSGSTQNPLGDQLGMGAYLNNYGSSAPKPITLTGMNSFTGNGATGLWLDSYGLVKVNNLTASYNGQDSIHCGSDCDGLDTPMSHDLKGFTLTGYGIFNGNGDNGMYVTTGGPTAITLTNLFASDNNGLGVYLDNFYAMGNSGVTLNGMNMFTHNGHTGLVVLSFGAITLNNVTASDNVGGDGVDVDNCYYSPGACQVTVPKPVTLKGTNTFNNNANNGLWVNSLGAITAKQVTANDNGDRGVYLDNQFGVKNYNITLSGYNMFNRNGSTGIEAYSNGNIVISNLTASGNHGGTVYAYNTGGAYLDNWSTTSAPVNVTLTGFNTFNGNGYDAGGGGYVGSGLIVISKGAITISNLTANDNYGNGAYLDNSSGTLARNITLTGANTFVNNGGDGLFFDSLGAVSLNQVTADVNGFGGVEGYATGNITLTCGNMYDNTFYGFYLLSGHTITLKGVSSYGNIVADTFTYPIVVTSSCPIP